MHRFLVLGAVLAAALLHGGAAGAWSWPADGPVCARSNSVRTATRPGSTGASTSAVSGGSPVRGPAAGTVTFAGSVPTHGRGVTILTADGYAVTLFHLDSIAVAKGDTVERAVLGTLGSSGDPEHGVPAVHLGIRGADEQEGYVDPLGLLPARRADRAAAASAPAPTPVAASAPAPPPVAPTAPGPRLRPAPLRRRPGRPAVGATRRDREPPRPSASRGRAAPVAAATQADPGRAADAAPASGVAQGIAIGAPPPAPHAAAGHVGADAGSRRVAAPSAVPRGVGSPPSTVVTRATAGAPRPARAHRDGVPTQATPLVRADHRTRSSGGADHARSGEPPSRAPGWTRRSSGSGDPTDRPPTRRARLRPPPSPSSRSALVPFGSGG